VSTPTDAPDLAARTPFPRSLAIQRRVLHALLMREVITRFGRKNLGALWLVVEPMLFTLGVAALWASAGLHERSPVPIIAFSITGYSSVLLWRNCSSRSSMAIESNIGLLYHRNVCVIDVLLTRILLEIGGATASFAVLAAFFTWIGWMPLPEDPLQVAGGWFMLAWFGTSLALVIGAGTAYSDIVEKLWHPASYLLFPLSGAAFMVDWLPPDLQDFVLALPMVHGVEILREGYFGNVVRTHYDAGYMAVSCLLLTLAGLYMVRHAGRLVEVP
jgi:capsular polysaccharide transport system permease protein